MKTQMLNSKDQAQADQKSPEMLRKEAEQLLKQAKEAEQTAKRAEEKSKNDQRIRALTMIHQAIVDRLKEALELQGTKSKTGNYHDSYRNGLPFIEVEPNVGIEISERYSYHGSENIVEVSIQVGRYGDRPQTWKASTVDQLNYQAIVKSIQKRIQKKKDDKDRFEARQLIYKRQEAMREANLAIEEKLETLLAGNRHGISISPSIHQENSVSFRFEAMLTAEEAERIILSIHAILTVTEPSSTTTSK